MKVFHTIQCLLVCVAMIAGAGNASAQQKRDVSIGIGSSSIAVAPARLAQELGLYEKHGLNAQVVVFDSGNLALAALVSKSVQIAVLGPGELFTANTRGQGLVTFANINKSFPGSLVLSKRVVDKLGVSAKASVSDKLKALDGLLIGSTSGTSIFTVVTKSSAAAVGANVRFTYMAQTAAPAALQTGALDGYVASSPNWNAQVLDGTAVLWLSGPGGDFPQQTSTRSASNLQVFRSFAEQNRDLLKSVVAVFDDFVRVLNERPADVKAAVAKLYPNVTPVILDSMFETESQAWRAKPLTKDDLVHELSLVKAGGIELPNIESIDLGSLIFPIESGAK